MRPDRKWMYQRWDGGYLNEEYISWVQEFLEFAKKEDSFKNSAQLRCPYSKCNNLKYLDVESIRDHLYRKGFVKNYYEWVCHGEEFSDSVLPSNEGNPYRDMVIDVLGSTYDDTYDESEDIEEDPHPDAKKLFDMLKDAEKPLYEGCKMSMLEMAARIINLKSEYNLPHRCVDGFTSLMNDSFPDRNLMTRSFYDTRKVLEGIIKGLSVVLSWLSAWFEDVRNESEVRIRDACYFQISSDGWKPKLVCYDENLVNLSVNLPNGTSVYRRAVFTCGRVPSKYAEEVLYETIADICGNAMHRCVGIVADKFKNTALRNIEAQNHWMVNVSCQYQAFESLIKHFYRELPLFKNVAESCLKLANFVNNKTPVRNSFHKYQLREYGHASLIRVPMKEHGMSNFEPVYSMVEDIMNSARVLQLVLMDDSYRIVSMEDPVAREFGEMIRDVGFWNDLEAVRSVVRMVREMAHDFETERPLVGQCLPLWEELRMKVKDWCGKFHIAESLVEKVIERQFRKNYHPAWAAAYILDPLYLIRDSSGKYLPPFKCLTPEQEKDVDKLITRLVSRDEAHIALMELMKWRTEGLDPVYAQAVQLKQRDSCTGKMKIANPHGSRLVWETYLPEFKSLGRVAVRLIFLNATARGFKCNSSFLKWVQTHGRCSRYGMDRVQKMIFIAAHARLERRDFTSDGDKDAELFASANEASDSDAGPGLPSWGDLSLKAGE